MSTNTSLQQNDAAWVTTEQGNSNRPIWLRISEAVKTRGIGRSTLYTLIAEGKIKSRVLKAQRDSIRGIRLISADSLDEFIERQES